MKVTKNTAFTSIVHGPVPFTMTTKQLDYLTSLDLEPPKLLEHLADLIAADMREYGIENSDTALTRFVVNQAITRAISRGHVQNTVNRSRDKEREAHQEPRENKPAAGSSSRPSTP